MKDKKFTPELIIRVTPNGVSEIRVPFRTLADQRIGDELRERCAPVVAILDEIARGTSQVPQ